MSSASGSSRSRAIASSVPGDGGPDGCTGGSGVACAVGGADDGLVSTRMHRVNTGTEVSSYLMVHQHKISYLVPVSCHRS